MRTENQMDLDPELPSFEQVEVRFQQARVHVWAKISRHSDPKIKRRLRSFLYFYFIFFYSDYFYF